MNDDLDPAALREATIAYVIEKAKGGLPLSAAIRAYLAAGAGRLKARETALREALKPFANLTPSSLHADGDDEEYAVLLRGGWSDKPDFRRSDIERARAALKDTP